MSDLLKKSILEAKAIKEAARKSVKNDLLAENSALIEQRLKVVLEQEGLDLDLESEEDSEDLVDTLQDDTPEASDIDVEFSHMSEPSDEKQELEIDIEDLVGAIQEEMDLFKLDEDDTPEEYTLEQFEQLLEEEGVDSVPSNVTPDDTKEEEENISFDYQEDQSLGQVFDQGSATTEQLKDHEDMEELRIQFKSLKENNESLSKSLRLYMKKYKSLKEENSETSKKHIKEKNELKSLVRKSVKQLESLKESNNKMIAINKILSDVSLNESQKQILLNKTSNCSSSLEIQTLHEMAAKAPHVGRQKEDSLREIVEKHERSFVLGVVPRNTITESTNKKEDSEVERLSERWAALAFDDKGKK